LEVTVARLFQASGFRTALHLKVLGFLVMLTWLPAIGHALPRGIQSVYFLQLDKDLVGGICTELNNAPVGMTVEIAFSASPKYAGRSITDADFWKNTDQAINCTDPTLGCITSRNLNLAIYFGHHTMEGISTTEAGALVYQAFKKYSKVNKFIVMVANEDIRKTDTSEGYSDTAWHRKMSNILASLRSSWRAENPRPATFPYAKFIVRRSGTTEPGDPVLGSTFKIDPGDANGFSVQVEYHLPAGLTPKPSTWANVVSNDGQILYREGVDPNPWAKNGTNLRQISLTTFMSSYGGRRTLLWHPVLHRWGKTANMFDRSEPPADASPVDRQTFLDLLHAFLHH
jgi:hypothetical protein